VTVGTIGEVVFAATSGGTWTVGLAVEEVTRRSVETERFTSPELAV
jgi:hypothetical protein